MSFISTAQFLELAQPLSSRDQLKLFYIHLTPFSWLAQIARQLTPFPKLTLCVHVHLGLRLGSFLESRNVPLKWPREGLAKTVNRSLSLLCRSDQCTFSLMSLFCSLPNHFALWIYSFSHTLFEPSKTWVQALLPFRSGWPLAYTRAAKWGSDRSEREASCVKPWVDCFLTSRFQL